MMRKNKSYTILSSLIVVAFLFVSCSYNQDELEAKRWSFYEYFNYVKEDSFRYKYENISLVNITRDKNLKNYRFFYKDSIMLQIDLKDDYSYKIVTYQYNSNSKPVEEIPAIVKQKLEEAVSDCKRLQLKSFQSSKDRFLAYFLMENIYLNSIPDTLKHYNWIADTARAQFEHNPYKGRKPVEGEVTVIQDQVTIVLKDNWEFTVRKPKNIHF